MARTAEGAALTQRHRAAQIALRAGMLRDLMRLWRVVDPVDLSGTINRFVSVATILVRARHRDSAGIASDYFRALRAVELGQFGVARTILADVLPVDVAAGTLRGAGLSGIITARRAGKSVQSASANGLVKVSGAASSLVLSGGRDTILRSTASDGAATGYRRVTSSGPCDYCATLASRSSAYTAERTESFTTHDHCGCTAEPQF